ncbi:AhpC/TSA family protein [Hymenobacter taeanensis]|uniref:AhpC/TSA family protein n=1 Tax=Hymenobacter taeanensis TaxID=2735321 RepID=A0A6M6BJI8_9BACT|nr:MULTISPECIES: TlpA disulfide reductase family protein [Hymenobacter]QJX47473.1 AhpC/TSA family protein [Hymenobacter taeanensis]UOQ83041.1 AhpC/TSA family protein [Hymenobacter sp. 5414T-23]
MTTPFIIKGKLGTLNAPAKVYLVRGMAITDSATLKNGAFELKGTTETPVTADLVFRRKGRLTSMYGQLDRTRVFLEPGTLLVTSPDSLAHATLKGGPATTDYVRLTESIKPIIANIQAFGAEAQKATEQQRQDAAYQEQMRGKFEAFNKQIATSYYTFIKANPNSWASLDALLGLQMLDLPQYNTVGPLYEALSPALKNSPQGREYGELVRGLKAVAIGAQAPDFTQKTPDGKTVSLRDYRGKYVLVDFWASWCGPCRQENPSVAKAYNEYKGRNFEVLGVSLDNEKDRAKWVKAIQDDQLPWTQVSDLRGWENEAARMYQVRGIPQNYLIDPTGKIIAANLKGADLRATLAQLIK